MSEKNATAFGMFPDRTSIENVVKTLRREGFQSSEVSVLFRENRGTWDPTNPSPKAAQDRTTATTFRASHGALRWLSGIGAIALPGQGSFVAVGPLRASLEGNAFGGTEGTLAGTLIQAGVPEDHARRYEGLLMRSSFLLSVRYSDEHQMTKVSRILEETFAEDVVSTDVSHAYAFKSVRSVIGLSASAGVAAARNQYSR